MGKGSQDLTLVCWGGGRAPALGGGRAPQSKQKGSCGDLAHTWPWGATVCRLRRRRRGRAASSHNRDPPSSGGIRVSDVLPD